MKVLCPNCRRLMKVLREGFIFIPALYVELYVCGSCGCKRLHTVDGEGKRISYKRWENKYVV